MRNLASVPRLLVATAKDFMEDKAPRLAAALSYYTAFSLPPLLVAVIGVAGIVYGVDEVRERIMLQVADLVGTDSAATLGDAVVEAQRSTGSGGALVLGVLTLLFGATGAFGQLQEASEHNLGGQAEEGRGSLATGPFPFALIRHNPRHRLLAAGFAGGEHCHRRFG